MLLRKRASIPKSIARAPPVTTLAPPPDPRSVAEARRHGIDITHYRGRQLDADDFYRFDWIIGMDRSNMAEISRRDPGDGKARIMMLLDMVPGREGAEVADPWYGGEDNFRDTWADVTKGAEALVAWLLAQSEA